MQGWRGGDTDGSKASRPQPQQLCTSVRMEGAEERGQDGGMYVKREEEGEYRRGLDKNRLQHSFVHMDT